MTVAHVMCNCYTCGRLIFCSPTLVPSIPANQTHTGTKEPVCRSCITIANPQRIANGLEPIVILDGAYEPDELDEVS